ncbi:MAG: hypothetical protein EOM56_08490 [Deltaproteobacteria bacterium]|nr:hypothetical protein [Deltaproteobacteria bacterium]
MKIRYSQPLKLFKKEVGNANHMLITILVGLDAIVDNEITPRSEFKVSWNPRDKSKSAERSKDFAKKASLVWMVDCLDMYLRLINRSPSIIFDNNLKFQMDGEAKSVYNKANIVAEFCGINGSIEYAMVDLIISWRNNLTHFNIDNKIKDRCRKVLVENQSIIRESYCHLDVVKMLESFEAKKIPTFKETASQFKALIDFVYSVDKYLIRNLDEICYAERILLHYIGEDPIKRMDNIFSKGKEKRERSLKEILKQHGFTQEADFPYSDQIDEFCNKIAGMSAIEVKECVEKKSFGARYSKA